MEVSFGINMIDAVLLEKIVTEVAIKRFAAELRELIVFSGSKDLCEIYARYLEEIEKRNEPNED